VKGYAAHERGTFDELTKLRASAQARTAATFKPAPKPNARSQP